jgi:hypothetical protein
MRPKTRAHLLAQDHAAYRRGVPLRDPKRCCPLDTKKLLAIAAIAGALLYPYKVTETSESQSGFHYGVIFGSKSQYQQSVQEIRCAELPLEAPLPTTRAGDATDPLAYSRTLVKEATELDQPSLQFPESIQTVLAKNVKKIEDLTSQMVEESLNGTPVPTKTIAHRLEAIRKTAEYFVSKKLPSLLLYTDTAMGELLNNTSPAELRIAESLLKNPTTPNKHFNPPQKPRIPSEARETHLFQ